MLTVERLDDGEVSPYLADELRAGDQLELRGPIGGYFVWEAVARRPAAARRRRLGRRAAARDAAPPRSDRERRAGAAALLVALARRGHLPRRARRGSPTTTRSTSRSRSPASSPTGWTGLRGRIDRELLARGRLAAGRAAARLRLRPDRLRRGRGRARSSRSATSPAGSGPSASARREADDGRRSTATRSPGLLFDVFGAEMTTATGVCAALRRERRRGRARGLPARARHRRPLPSLRRAC